MSRADVRSVLDTLSELLLDLTYTECIVSLFRPVLLDLVLSMFERKSPGPYLSRFERICSTMSTILPSAPYLSQ